MARRLKYGLKATWWFWRNLPEQMRLVLNLTAFTALGVIAALAARDYPLSWLDSTWLNLGLYWIAAWMLWQPVKILTVMVGINRRPERVEQLKAWLDGDSDERKSNVR